MYPEIIEKDPPKSTTTGTWPSTGTTAIVSYFTNKAFIYFLGYRPLFLFMFYVDNLKYCFHCQKKII